MKSFASSKNNNNNKNNNKVIKIIFRERQVNCSLVHSPCCIPFKEFDGICSLPNEPRFSDWSDWTVCKNGNCGGCGRSTRTRECMTNEQCRFKPISAQLVLVVTQSRSNFAEATLLAEIAESNLLIKLILGASERINCGTVRCNALVVMALPSVVKFVKLKNEQIYYLGKIKINIFG